MDAVKLAQAISRMMNALEEADKSVAIVLSIMKDDPSAWEQVRNHYKGSSKKLDELLEKRGIVK